MNSKHYYHHRNLHILPLSQTLKYDALSYWVWGDIVTPEKSAKTTGGIWLWIHKMPPGIITWVRAPGINQLNPITPIGWEYCSFQALPRSADHISLPYTDSWLCSITWFIYCLDFKKLHKDDMVFLQNFLEVLPGPLHITIAPFCLCITSNMKLNQNIQRRVKLNE